MAYTFELTPGHRVYLDNQGNQTIVTTTMGLPGQQQQASNSMTTGIWTSAPEAYRVNGGAVLKIFTAQGETSIYLQGSQVSMTTTAPSVAGAQPMPMQSTETVPSMLPMPPMTMGNMQMSMNPMEMRMGNMELKMNTANQISNPSPQSSIRQFCSQCGTKVAPDDKFCSSCGCSLS